MENERAHTDQNSLENHDREAGPSEDGNGDHKKLFAGFVEKLILLCLGFLLTTLVGGYLTDRFRKENAKTELEIAAMQSDIGRSVQVFENISQLMDKRLFRMRRLHDVFNGNIGSDSYEQRLSDYRTVLIEWNDNVNRYRALYAFSFTRTASVTTSSCSESFEAISSGFTIAHGELQKLIDKKEDASTGKVQSLLDDLNVCIYFLDEKMLSNIRDQQAVFKDRITNR